MPTPHARRKRRFFTVLMLGLLVLALAACEWTDLVDGDGDEDDTGSDNTPPATETNVPGLSVAIAGDDFDTTESALDNRIANSTTGRTVVDHQQNAGSNSSLRPTTVFLFDLPIRTAPLVVADARVALDLPPRMLVYRDRDGDVAVAYTNAAYLDARYDLDGAENGALAGLDDDLETIASDVTGGDPSTGAASGIGEGEGIESVSSDNDFTTTLNTLTNDIQLRDDLTLVDTVDFQAQAASVGRNLATPATLVIFGNPDAGTSLIRASQTIGVDLPQKMLVSADASGNVTIYYNDPDFIADRHDIDGRDDTRAAIDDLLGALACTASGQTNCPDPASETASDTDGETGTDNGAGRDPDSDTAAGDGASPGIGDPAGADTGPGAGNDPGAGGSSSPGIGDPAGADTSGDASVGDDAGAAGT